MQNITLAAQQALTATLIANLLNEYKLLLAKAENGVNIDDDIADELGDYFDVANEHEYDIIQISYKLVRSMLGENSAKQARNIHDAIVILDL